MADRAPNTRRARSLPFGDRVLTLAAAAGAVCLLLVVLAWARGVSLVLFRTGSMAPTIPAGSLAVVQEVGSDVVEIGDVVTVDRPGRLPVTHRVVDVGRGTDPVTLTLQGDANAAPDAETYRVPTVRRVLWSVPGVGWLVGRLQRPVVLGATAVAVAALVTWGLWPREDVTKITPRPPRDSESCRRSGR